VLHFVVPFYNSGGQLPGNVLALRAFLERDRPGDFEIVLCDDGSTDGSRAAAERLAGGVPEIRVVGYAPNRGRGYAVRFAAAACAAGGALIFADLDLPQTTDLSRIRDMADRLADVPIVVGSRFLRASRVKRLRRRDLMGKLHHLAVRLLLPRLKVKDPDAGFKGFDLGALAAISAVSREDRWSWDMEALTIARANGLAIAEIPIDWNERHEAYATSVKLLRDAWEEFTGILRIRKALRRGRYALQSSVSEAR
jgi:glycosyltransferase involved in cell wall biosynthesis